MEDLHQAGGVPAVLRELLSADLIDGGAMTVSGGRSAKRPRRFRAVITD
jgi:dihydroxyacid dehydratase/phosphogluconate dehydratase